MFTPFTSSKLFQPTVEPDATPAQQEVAGPADEPVERRVGHHRSPNRLGSARRAAAPAAAATVDEERSDARPAKRQKGQRIRVWWTEDRRWFAGTITSFRQGSTHVMYDAVDSWAVTRMWHDLESERWEPI